MSPTQQAMLDLDAAIAEANGRFMSSFAARDAAAIGRLYTSDAQALPPGGDVAYGPDAIAAVFRGAMDAGVRKVQLKTVELSGLGPVVIEVGRNVVEGDAGAEIDHGKYIVIWKQDGGALKIHRDFWNSSEPPSA